jgi:NAD+ diphosphatase
MALDRASTLRADPAWIARRLEDTSSRAVFAGEGGILIRDGDAPELARRSLRDLAGAGVILAEPLLLGLEQGRALFGVDLDALPRAAFETLTHGVTVSALRAAGAVLAQAEGGLAAYLVALLNWHRRHHFCPNCGTSTAVSEAGYSRRCPSCGAVHFPRTDPVVIMVVDGGGQLLLGRQANWPPRRYSVLAGYVAPGETLEEAVAREVREESGIEVADPRYVASQPWPFPASLMVGFEARSDGGEPVARDGELEDVRWFSLDAARRAVRGESSELVLPPTASISRLLIERWVAGGGL